MRTPAGTLFTTGPTWSSTASRRCERRGGALLKRHHLKIVDFELYRRRRLGRPCRGGVERPRRSGGGEGAA